MRQQPLPVQRLSHDEDFADGVRPASGRQLRDNAAIESFNGRFGEECLNVSWFQSPADAPQKIDGPSTGPR